MTPEDQIAAVDAVEAALQAQEREARIARNLETYRRGLASWIAKVDHALADQQQKAEN